MRIALLRLALIAPCVLACGAPATNVCPPGERRSEQSCYVATSGAEAATTVATGAVLWTIEGGCKVAGCVPPLNCNRDTGFCERPQCDEARHCPNNTQCNTRLGRCEP